MSDKIELGKLCGVLQSKFLCLSQSESRTQPCHVRIQNYKTIVIVNPIYDDAIDDAIFFLYTPMTDDIRMKQ